MGENIYDGIGTEYVEETPINLGGTEYVDERKEGIFLGDDSKNEPIVIEGANQNYHFQSEKKRGGGQQSSVYSCYGDDQKEYIVKLYDHNSINLKKLRDVLNFLQERNHENITRILEHGNCQILGAYYYYVIMNVYQPLDKSIFEWKNEDGDIYRKNVTKFLEELNEAMRFIHKRDIFHGDIKPENIMIDPETNKYVLIDFGGAARTSEDGKTSVTAIAITHPYSPPEVVRNGRRISRYSDYYSLGVTIAELINGTYPSQKKVEEKFEEVKAINAFRIPANLPAHYENLLQGLLFYDYNEDEERIKEYRWASEKVDTWLDYVKRNALPRAAEINKTPINVVGMMEQMTDGASDLDFGNTLTLLIGKGKEQEKHTLTNLTQMADKFLHPDKWSKVVERFLSITPARNPFSDIKGDIRELVQEGIDRMQRARDNRNSGLSINAEFFKFMFNYVSNAYIYPVNAESPTFYWIDLPNVKNLDGFIGEFRNTLLDIQEINGEFGKWWTQMGQKNRGKHTIIAEIFRNKVLSFYLDRIPGTSNELILQCEKVEAYFDELRTSYTKEELTEMFVLQRMLGEMDWYELVSGEEYETYDEFLKDLEAKAYDVTKVEQTTDIVKSVKDKNGFYPDFLAWKRMSGY